MRLASFLSLLLLACSSPAEPELVCPAEACEWCDHLKGDVVIDSLLPLPDSAVTP